MKIRKLNLLTTFTVFFYLSAKADFNSEFSLLSEKNTGSPLGKIYLIGTYHEDVTETAATATADLTRIESCKRGYVEIINSFSHELDIVLDESLRSPINQMTPSNHIVRQNIQGQTVHTRFNKNFYVVGWEEPISFAIARVANSILKSARALGQRDEDVIVSLKAKYFYYYAVLYLRNESALKILSDAVARAPKNKNIFILMGGNHFDDPRFMTQVQNLNRDYQFWQTRNVKENFHVDFLATELLLKLRGVDVTSLRKIAEDLRKNILAQGGLTQKDITAAQRQIFSDTDLCSLQFL